jgi:hypothetical protein
MTVSVSSALRCLFRVDGYLVIMVTPAGAVNDNFGHPLSAALCA